MSWMANLLLLSPLKLWIMTQKRGPKTLDLLKSCPKNNYWSFFRRLKSTQLFQKPKKINIHGQIKWMHFCHLQKKKNVSSESLKRIFKTTMLTGLKCFLSIWKKTRNNGERDVWFLSLLSALALWVWTSRTKMQGITQKRWSIFKCHCPVWTAALSALITTGQFCFLIKADQEQSAVTVWMLTRRFARFQFLLNNQQTSTHFVLLKPFIYQNMQLRMEYCALSYFL